MGVAKASPGEAQRDSRAFSVLRMSPDTTFPVTPQVPVWLVFPQPSSELENMISLALGCCLTLVTHQKKEADMASSSWTSLSLRTALKAGALGSDFAMGSEPEYVPHNPSQPCFCGHCCLVASHFSLGFVITNRHRASLFPP